MKYIKTLAFCLFIFSQTIIAQNIVINEVLSANTSNIKDEDDSYQDWIELYNNGISTINLNGYGLSDDASLLYKWIFPNVSIAPGQYLLIWASDKDRRTPGSPLHANFKISSAGEVLSLTNPSGITVDFATATAVTPNVSYGRLPNGNGGFMFFQNVTPNAVNGAIGYSGILEPPVFSQGGGFFTTSFSLNLSTPVPGATILYTLDGSEPDANNLGGTTYSYKNQYPELPGQSTGPLLSKSFQTFQYASPINIIDRSSQPNKIAAISSTYHFEPYYIPASPIYKGTVVRAKVIKPGSLPSVTTTKSYFITPQTSSRFSLPVVSLSISENKLYDYNDGIYVAGVDFDNWRVANPALDHNGIEDLGNFYRRGIEYEKMANMTYFKNGIEEVNQDVGLRIHGGSSREWQNKSLTIYARDEYGKSHIDFNFFSDNNSDDFERIILRNSGADFYETLFKDALNQGLIKSLRLITKGYQPTITFINGEYWGILNLRDKVDGEFFKRVLNIPEDEIDILGSTGVIQEGDNDHYLAMINFLENNSLAGSANYDYIKTQLDPDNFTDYFISNIYFQNIDWPGNNLLYWRKKTAAYEPNAPFGHDGRWRWLAHDMDATFATNSHNIDLNSLAAATATNGPSWPNPAWSTLILRKMLENNSYKTQFINRFADLMNTSFLSSRVVNKIDEMEAVLQPEMAEQIARWQAPLDLDFYLQEEKDFANQRPAFQRNHIRSQFGISSNIDAALDVSDINAGYIKMNTIDIKTGTPGIISNPYPWTGIYFSNIPVTIKATANPGFVFDHWTGASTSTSPEITITSATNFALTAVFAAETVATNHPIYFWFMNSIIENNIPLETLNTTYRTGSTDGVIQYQSCLLGYPFTSSSPNWRKASMERRNSPTDINYIPETNSNLPFSTSDMKGLQVKEPLQNNGLENKMVFNFSTAGYKDIKFSFTAINELTNANNIIIDYAVNSGSPIWTATGLASNTFPLSSGYQLFNIDFSSITAANNNLNFKVRLRFSGTEMTADNGARITFNNIAVLGTQLQLAIQENNAPRFGIYPNPFSEIIKITGVQGNQETSYKLFTIDGKQIKQGSLENAQANFPDLSRGMYLLRLTCDGKSETKKIIKK